MGALDICGGKINVLVWIGGSSVVDVGDIFLFRSSESGGRLELHGDDVIHDDIVRLYLC